MQVYADYIDQVYLHELEKKLLQTRQANLSSLSYLTAASEGKTIPNNHDDEVNKTLLAKLSKNLISL